MPAILDGDMVLVEEDSTASNGDMVVALIDDGATVKTFYKEEGVFRLQPENDFMDPIIVKDVTILGKVICRDEIFELIYRKLKRYNTIKIKRSTQNFFNLHTSLFSF